MPSKKRTAYRTPSNQPKCVHYWDKNFKNKSYSFDWQAMRAEVTYMLKEIEKALNITKKEAQGVAWNAYCHAVCDDDESPFYDSYLELFDVIPEEEIPEFIMHKSIGADIHQGMTEKQARRQFIKWLKEDPDNGNFGAFRMNPDLTVIRQ